MENFTHTPSESFLRLRNKNVGTEIYSNIQACAFQVLPRMQFFGVK